MIRICRSYRFEAAHFLPYVQDGHKCKRMHGHNYRVDFAISGNLNKYGFVCDFAHIDDDVLPLIKKLDHRVINEIIENPTAEIIAQWFFEHLLIYDLVRVYENDDSWAEVSK